MAKTYNTFTDVATGDVYTAASHNAILTNLGNYRVPPMCVLRKNANQTGIGTGGALVTWQTEDADTDGMHDGSTNTDRITIQTAGAYQISAVLGLNSIGAGQIVYMRLRKNGSDLLYVTGHDIGAASGWTISAAVVAAVNDYFSMQVQTTTGTINVESAYSIFSATWLGQVS